MRPKLGPALLLLVAVTSSGPVAPTRRVEGSEEKPRPLLLAHYMPWCEAKPVSDHWGWHWTMGHFDPEKTDSKGQRQIASHDYPLIGPYDSSDPSVLEYHTLLMRIAGIDGVIADWYGSEPCHDYAAIHQRTSALFNVLRRRELKFAVCYEDRALKAMADRDKLSPAQVIDHGRTHLEFCERTWCSDPAYVTLDGKPLLLVFGPDYLKPTQWEAIFAGLKRPPTFLTLHEQRPPASGSFAWPPMWASKDGTLNQNDLDAYLDRFAGQSGRKIPAVFPGFHDIYQEAGVQPSHGFLDPRQGATFRQTLSRAWGSGSPLIQLATWNDFGEGTHIEPARDHGYRDLETIQEARRRSPGPPFPFRADDLRVPLRIYGLRQRVAPSSPESRTLDEAVDAVFAADLRRALPPIEALEERSPAQSSPGRSTSRSR